MDLCASVLLAFPPDSERPVKAADYDAAAKSHVIRVARLLKEQPALAAQLLDVS
jgi:hypothetical protein